MSSVKSPPHGRCVVACIEHHADDRIDGRQLPCARCSTGPSGRTPSTLLIERSALPAAHVSIVPSPPSSAHPSVHPSAACSDACPSNSYFGPAHLPSHRYLRLRQDPSLNASAMPLSRTQARPRMHSSTHACATGCTTTSVSLPSQVSMSIRYGLLYTSAMASQLPSPHSPAHLHLHTRRALGHMPCHCLPRHLPFDPFQLGDWAGIRLGASLFQSFRIAIAGPSARTVRSLKRHLKELRIRQRFEVANHSRLPSLAINATGKNACAGQFFIP
jgi:hypothetical protein